MTRLHLRARLGRLDDRLLPTGLGPEDGAGEAPAAVPAWVRAAVVLALPLAVLAVVLAASGAPAVRRLCVLPVAGFLGLAAALLVRQRRARE